MRKLLEDYLRDSGYIDAKEELSETRVIINGDEVQYRLEEDSIARTRSVDVADILEWMYKKIQE